MWIFAFLTEFACLRRSVQLICLCVNRVSQKSTNWLIIIKFNFFLCVQLSDGAFPAVTVLGGCV